MFELTKTGKICQMYELNWQMYKSTMVQADHGTSWPKMVRVDRLPNETFNPAFL